jgi:glycosyltransferase involved in cell wall biosynthesis
MASGLPVITTRVGGLDQVIRDGDNGFIIEPGDRAALADRLHRLLNSFSIRQRMGASGQSKAGRDFDLRRNLRKLLDAVERRLSPVKSAMVTRFTMKEESVR